jgi:hypothetical protein
MANALLSNRSRDFWKEVQKVRGGKCNLPTNIDGVLGKENIGNLFSAKYKNMYNTVSYNTDDMDNLMADVNTRIMSECCSSDCVHQHEFTVDDIENAITCLNAGKGDGDMAQSTDHLINGTKMLSTMLSLMFKCMIVHGHSPQALLNSTIVSIPKSKRKSANDSNNYRGIALSSSIGKFLDSVILNLWWDKFASSDLQFGYKPDSSTTHCTFVVKETIQYYMNKDSSVFVMLLDASQAFDRVHYVKLFRLLLKKGLCPLVARLLAVMYTNQYVRVKWGDFTGDYFAVSNGVKQGGVLSPILFGIYMDELLLNLQACGQGCYIGQIFMGAFAYADDASLLAPSKQALKYMLGVVKQFSDQYNVVFNPGKSKLLVFEKEDHGACSITFNGKEIQSSPVETHLGTKIGPGVCSQNIKSSVNDLYWRTNITLCQFDNAFSWVKYKLFKSFSMSIYGCQLWNLSDKNTELFYVAWRKCVRRVWGVPYRTHNQLLPAICNDLPVRDQVYKRLLKFVVNACNSSNICVRLCAKLAIDGSRSDTCNSINAICNKYRLCKYDFAGRKASFFVKKIYKLVESDTQTLQTAGNILDMIKLRDDPSFLLFTNDELGDMIHLECTY